MDKSGLFSWTFITISLHIPICNHCRSIPFTCRCTRTREKAPASATHRPVLGYLAFHISMESNAICHFIKVRIPQERNIRENKRQTRLILLLKNTFLESSSGPSKVYGPRMLYRIRRRKHQVSLQSPLSNCIWLPWIFPSKGIWNVRKSSSTI